jgi:hypothetical protein
VVIIAAIVFRIASAHAEPSINPTAVYAPATNPVAPKTGKSNRDALDPANDIAKESGAVLYLAANSTHPSTVIAPTIGVNTTRMRTLYQRRLLTD